MAARLSDYHQEWPVWAVLNRPGKLSNRPSDVLLRLEIPKSRLLVSFYEGWLKLLGVMYHLDRHCNGKWPEQWISYQEAPYLDPAKGESTEPTPDVPRAKPWFFDEKECRKTWERIFDLTLYAQERFAWDACSGSPLLQAVIPVVYRSDLTTTFGAS